MPQRSSTVIESLGVYLPQKAVTTAEVLAGCAQPVQFPLEEMTGIRTRRVVGEGEFAIDLAEKALRDCLAHSRHAPEDVDLLICASISRLDAPSAMTYEPSTAMTLRQRCGLAGALAFDVTNACAGMFTALYLVDQLIQLGAIRRGIVVSGEYITHLTATAQREIKSFLDPQLASLTLGDAGAAVLLEAAPCDDVGFHGLDLYTVAKFSPMCVAKPSRGGGGTMATDTIQATAAGLEHMTIHSTNMMNRSHLPGEAYRHVIPHQTSRTSMNEGISEIARLFHKNVAELLIDNLPERGNTASTSHFVALRDQILKGRIQSGDSAVFCISGSGMTVGTALYTFDDLPDRLRGTAPKPSAPVAVTAPTSNADPIGKPPRVAIEAIGTAMATPWQVQNTTRQMLVRAGEACLERSACDRREIDLLVSVGVYRTDYIAEPAIATLAAADLKINDDCGPEDQQRTFAFDLYNGALGFLNACHVCAGLIKAGRHRRAMIVAAEVENNTQTTSPDRLGLKETASAVILQADGDGLQGFGEFHFRGFLEYLDDFQSATALCEGETRVAIRRSPKLEEHYLQCLAVAVEEFLAREGIEPSRIAAVFPPQISPEFIRQLAEALGIDASRCVTVADGSGDLFTSSLPAALWRARGKQLVGPGDLGLLLGVAPGIQVGCALYHF